MKLNDLEDYAINVRKLEDFKILMELLREDGFEWKDLTKPSKYDGEWYNYEEKTCICCDEILKEIYYSDIEASLEDGYAVISFASFKTKLMEDKTQNEN